MAELFATVKTGELAGSASAVQMPDKPCSRARVKACNDNTGAVCVGFSNSVTLPDGTTDTTTGFPLYAGDDTGWIEITNLNLLYYISATGDDLVYWTIG